MISFGYKYILKKLINLSVNSFISFYITNPEDIETFFLCKSFAKTLRLFSYINPFLKLSNFDYISNHPNPNIFSLQKYFILSKYN